MRRINLAMNLSEPLPDEGIKVPIFVSFTGVKGVPLWALGSNNAYPLLRFLPDQIEMRVIRPSFRPYSDIERAEIFQKFKSNNLRFEWKDTRFTFSANVIRRDWLWQVVAFLARRAVPLGEQATQFLSLPCPDLSRPG